jgi:glucose/arabinose dehydrogenase
MRFPFPAAKRSSVPQPLTILCVLSLFLVGMGTGKSAAAAIDLSTLALPEGFSIGLVSDALPNARQLALSTEGTLFVGTLEAGKVYAIANALGADPEPPVVIAQNLTMPSGVALNGTDLYVGALNRILRFSDIDANLKENADFTVVTDTLPDKTHHGWKYLDFGTDGALYIPVGAPCNICLSDDPRFASMLRMDLASGDVEVYASGIRNTVGFDWHPTTNALWFTENGRDLLGDDIPSDEVNVATGPGSHFGYPFVHAGTLPDPEYGTKVPQETRAIDFTAPRAVIQAHSAALGIAFYTGQQFPHAYHHALFIAEHGSWNRSSKVGYRVSVITFDEAGEHYAPFVSGWLAGEENWGRPNDVLVAPDGSLLISDDQAGAVYRVRYQTD